MTPPLRRSRLPFLGLASLTALAAALSSSTASAQTGFLGNRFESEREGERLVRERVARLPDQPPAGVRHRGRLLEGSRRRPQRGRVDRRLGHQRPALPPPRRQLRPLAAPPPRRRAPARAGRDGQRGAHPHRDGPVPRRRRLRRPPARRRRAPLRGVRVGVPAGPGHAGVPAHRLGGARHHHGRRPRPAARHDRRRHRRLHVRGPPRLPDQPGPRDLPGAQRGRRAVDGRGGRAPVPPQGPHGRPRDLRRIRSCRTCSRRRRARPRSSSARTTASTTS